MKVSGKVAGIPRPISADELSRTPTAAKETHEVKKADQASKNVLQHTEPDKAEMTISDKVIFEAIERANRAVSIANRRFEYSIHEKTKEIMVKVIDAETEEVIREIPPEKILDLVAMIWEMIGLIVDERR